MFLFFGCKVCGILAPQPGIKSATSALEGQVLTTGPPGKPPNPHPAPHWLILITSYSRAGVSKLFLKGPDSKYLRLHELHGLLQVLNSAILVWK